MSKFSQTSLNLDAVLDVEQSRPGLMEWEQSSDLIALDGTETFFTFSLIFFFKSFISWSLTLIVFQESLC